MLYHVQLTMLVSMLWVFIGLCLMTHMSATQLDSRCVDRFLSRVELARAVPERGRQVQETERISFQELHQKRTRALQQEGEVTVVTTAAALQEAVVGGKPYIEIQAHLDLTTLDMVDGALLGVLPSTVQSIRGNCSDPTPPLTGQDSSHAPLRPLLPDQCLLLVDDNLLLAYGGNLWLHGLYVRLTTPRDTGSGFEHIISVDGTLSELWMTSITLQGNGDGMRDCEDCGLQVDSGQVYAQGCTFTNLDGSRVAYASDGATVSLVDCNFENNTLLSNRTATAVVQADADDGNGGAEVWLDGCTFSGNSPSTVPTLLANNRGAENTEAVFYSDSKSPSICTYEGSDDDSSTAPQCVSRAAKPLNEAVARDFLTASDEFLVEVQKAVGTGSISSSDTGGKASSGVGVVAGGAAAAVLALLAAVAAFLFVRRRQRAADTRKQNLGSLALRAVQIPPAADDMTARAYSISALHSLRTGTTERQNMTLSEQSGDIVVVNNMALASTQMRVYSSITDPLFTTDACSTEEPWRARVVPPRNTSADELANPNQARKKLIHQMLDCFGPEHRLLGRYELLGTGERRTGGQSVVQFARRIDGTGTNQFALKFFATQSSFNEEAGIYRGAPYNLKQFMPSIAKYVDNVDGSVTDPFGNALPPFIVMEKGESLSDRAKYIPVDLFTAAQVLGHVSERIAELHAAGYVHRDLKPGNIMWQVRNYSWVLIDFGISSRLGALAPVAYTPHYAAPETVLARHRGESTVKADAAVDAWALGVIAFELLVQHPAFGHFANIAEVHAMLTDPDKLLPWEDGCISKQDKKKLGRFRRPIQKVLQRDPCMRATVKQFSADVRGLFASTSKADTNAYNAMGSSNVLAANNPVGNNLVVNDVAAGNVPVDDDPVDEFQEATSQNFSTRENATYCLSASAVTTAND